MFLFLNSTFSIVTRSLFLCNGTNVCNLQNSYLCYVLYELLNKGERLFLTNLFIDVELFNYAICV